MTLFYLRPATTLRPSVLLGSQFVFNIGFYAVVPFLAIFLRDDMRLSGAIIGLVLGLRTFSQQGMFILGGALSDRYGAKVVILSGCIVRVVGYLLLAFGQSLWPIILGACLTGIGGALFSPSIEALLAKTGTYSEVNGKRSRAEWFALFAVCGELGAVLGPVVGALLTGLGFRQVALLGAGVFVIALVVLYFCLPATHRSERTLEIVPWWTTFRQPRFVAFITAYSSWLLSYNQLYLALPVEIQRSGGNEKDLGPLFMLASILIIAFQLPLARFARRVGSIKTLPMGFLLLSAAFGSVAMFAATPPLAGWLRLMPSACLVTLLTLGQMLLVPSAKDLIPRFANESTLGAHYGALATAGGFAVLTGNLLFGPLLDKALVPSTQAIYPWLLLALFPLCSAAAMTVICWPLQRTLGEKTRIR
ncbi:MFS transporter (plasmid) [Klebsiella sp. CTHL.F3a]|uniref:MDR family MFS transporter n=1 Tax=Klebsiella sp. CTHL.F3a TaxID=2873296 RepID=UPI001CA6E0CA|nr:MFS transporter [Klebsiella sp. CTHL.F3a]QZY83023.1 MFS transporter [Klebsiella sp. CTHL.F3a]